jgi:hypothetical protein
VLVGGGSGTRGGTSVEPIICAAQGSRKQAVKYGWPTVCALLAAFTLHVRTTVVLYVRVSVWRRLCMANLSIRAPVLVEDEDDVLALMMLCSCSRTRAQGAIN